jgi:hypothetical protein
LPVKRSSSHSRSKCVPGRTLIRPALSGVRGHLRDPGHRHRIDPKPARHPAAVDCVSGARSRRR